MMADQSMPPNKAQTVSGASKALVERLLAALAAMMTVGAEAAGCLLWNDADTWRGCWLLLCDDE